MHKMINKWRCAKQKYWASKLDVVSVGSCSTGYYKRKPVISQLNVGW